MSKKEYIVCNGGPLNDRWVDSRLGESWVAAVWVNYGSRPRMDKGVPRYDHVLGTYVLEDGAYWWQPPS